MRWSSMNDMALEFKQICDPKRLREMYAIDVEKATLDAFEFVKFKPSKDVKKAIDKTWVNSDRNDWLWEFVYKVWSECQ